MSGNIGQKLVETGKYVVPPKHYGTPGSKLAITLAVASIASFLLYKGYVGGRMREDLCPSFLDDKLPSCLMPSKVAEPK